MALLHHLRMPADKAPQVRQGEEGGVGGCSATAPPAHAGRQKAPQVRGEEGVGVGGCSAAAPPDQCCRCCWTVGPWVYDLILTSFLGP